MTSIYMLKLIENGDLASVKLETHSSWQRRT